MCDLDSGGLGQEPEERERLKSGYKSEPPPKRPSSRRPVVTPLPVPFFVLGSRLIRTSTAVWKIGWKFRLLLISETTETTKTNHHASPTSHDHLKYVPCLAEEDGHQPNRGPGGSSSSKTRESGKESSSPSTPGHPTGVQAGGTGALLPPCRSFTCTAPAPARQQPLQ